MLTIYIIGLCVAALLVGFIGPDDGAMSFTTVILWPIFGLILIGALIRDLTDTLRYNRRKR